jgi:TRAP-type C4-dicarboxylate transport system substrate-binding protein
MPLVKQGGIELGTVGAGYHPSEFPLVSSLSEYPWLTFDQAAWVITRLYDEVPALDAEWKKNNIMQLCHGILGPYGMVSRKPLKSLDELKNLKVRAFGKYVPRRMAKLGMVPLETPSTEIYEALSKGGIDCTLSNLDQHRSLGLWEIAKYHLKGDFFPVVWNSASPIMNLTLFNSLEPDIRKILLDLKAEYIKKNIQLIEETDAADEKFLKDKGVIFSSISEAENKRVRQGTLEVFESMLAEMKAQKKELAPSIDALQAALTRLNTEYLKTHR